MPNQKILDPSLQDGKYINKTNCQHEKWLQKYQKGFLWPSPI